MEIWPLIRGEGMVTLGIDWDVSRRSWQIGDFDVSLISFISLISWTCYIHKNFVRNLKEFDPRKLYDTKILIFNNVFRRKIIYQINYVKYYDVSFVVLISSYSKFACVHFWKFISYVVMYKVTMYSRNAWINIQHAQFSFVLFWPWVMCKYLSN